MTEQLKLTEIKRIDKLQARFRIDPETVRSYAEKYKSGINFPTLSVYRMTEPSDQFGIQEGDLILVDGWHRYQALESLNRRSASCEVQSGTFDEAIAASLSANECNGMRRTTQDREKAIRMALFFYPDHSDRRLSRIVNCSHTFVNAYRRQLDQYNEPGPRIGTDGIARNTSAKRFNGQGQDIDDPEIEQVMQWVPDQIKELVPKDKDLASKLVAQGEKFVRAFAQDLYLNEKTLAHCVKKERKLSQPLTLESSIESLVYHWIQSGGPARVGPYRIRVEID